MKSPSVLYSDLALTANTRSNVPTIDTISKSFTGSNGRLVERRHADRGAVGDQRHGVAVGRRVDHRARGIDAARAGHVLDHDTLAEFVAELVGQDARGDVGDAAGAERQHDLAPASPAISPAPALSGASARSSRRQRQQREQTRFLIAILPDVLLRHFLLLAETIKPGRIVHQQALLRQRGCGKLRHQIDQIGLVGLVGGIRDAGNRCPTARASGAASTSARAIGTAAA